MFFLDDRERRKRSTTPDLPDECPALVETKPLDQVREEEIARRQIELLENPHKEGKLLSRRREELYDRW